MTFQTWEMWRFHIWHAYSTNETLSNDLQDSDLNLKMSHLDYVAARGISVANISFCSWLLTFKKYRICFQQGNHKIMNLFIFMIHILKINFLKNDANHKKKYHIILQGTLIRVFDVATRKQLVELRRGADPAMLYWYV